MKKGNGNQREMPKELKRLQVTCDLIHHEVNQMKQMLANPTKDTKNEVKKLLDKLHTFVKNAQADSDKLTIVDVEEDFDPVYYRRGMDDQECTTSTSGSAYSADTFPLKSYNRMDSENDSSKKRNEPKVIKAAKQLEKSKPAEKGTAQKNKQAIDYSKWDSLVVDSSDEENGPDSDLNSFFQGLDMPDSSEITKQLSNPSPTQWAVGLAFEKQAEFLIDTYRMRCDDEYVYGQQINGLYASYAEWGGCEVIVIVKDFFLFCKLAVNSKSIPSNWNWASFLELAEKELVFAFERSDAEEKYGPENLLSVLKGGRSLHYTGETIYGTNVMDPARLPRESSQLEYTVDGIFDKYIGVKLNKKLKAQLFEPERHLFRDVGGVVPWRKLACGLKVESRNNYR